jgi:uncharacterized protein YjbI with pentapeptide repeats
MPPVTAAAFAVALSVAMASGLLAALGQSMPLENASEQRSTLTAKEKLGDKAADEQRVNDCKVPAAQRIRSDRPTECASGSADTSMPTSSQSADAVHAAQMTIEALTGILRDATPSNPPQLAGWNLSGLDLSNIDFRQADLSGANLFGAKLVGANLAGTNLSGANLDAAWLMRASFAGANLANASIFGPVVYPTLEVSPAEAPNFAKANLSGARIIARLNRVDMRGSNLAGARMGVDMRNQPMGQMRMDLSGADLSGADFSGADLNRAAITFAKLRGADLQKARLFRADLSGSDFTGADLTGADLTEADLQGAIMREVRGLDHAIGFETALNREKITQ